MATAKIETTVGVIEFELLDDAAPKTVRRPTAITEANSRAFTSSAA